MSWVEKHLEAGLADKFAEKLREEHRAEVPHIGIVHWDGVSPTCELQLYREFFEKLKEPQK